MKFFQIKNKILVCGFPRSGTTWLSKLIDSDPTVYLLSEPDKKSNCQFKLGRVTHFIHSDINSWTKAYREGLDELIENTFANFINYPIFEKDYFNSTYNSYLLFATLIKIVDVLTSNKMSHHLKLPKFFLKEDKPINLLWKSVNQSSNLHFVKKCFPDIKIIYIIRNPFFSIASSLRKKNMSLDEKEMRRIYERKESTFFTNNNIDINAITNYSSLYLRTLRWRIENENAILDGNQYNDFYLLFYEDLCKNPYEETAKLYKWLDIELTENTKSFIYQSIGKQIPSLANRLLSIGYFGVIKKTSHKKTKLDNLSEDQLKAMHEALNGSFIMKNWYSNYM